MKLDRLEIAGFFHFPTPAVVDLRDVQSGLVAIVGPNGNGKTRLLDAGLAGIYGPGAANGAFPSRDGTLAEYATERNAYIDTLWTVGAEQFRARVAVDAVSRNSKASLEKIPADGLPYSVNDGKVSTFREVVAGIFPSRAQVLASAFAAQGHQGSFVALDQKGKLALFSELLSLGHYAQHAATAKRCVTSAEKARASLLTAQSILAATGSAAEIGRCQQEAATARMELSSGESARSAAYDDVVVAEREVDGLRDDAAQHARNTVAVETASFLVVTTRNEIDRLEHERAKITRQYQETVTRLAATRRAGELELAKRYEADAAASLATVATLTGKIVKNQNLLLQADAVRRAVADVEKYNQELERLRADEHKVSVLMTAKRDEVSELNDRIRACAQAESGAVDARRQAALLSTVPCHGDGAYAACGFLAEATRATGRIPLLDEAAVRLPTLRADVRAVDDVIDGYRVRLDSVRAEITTVAAALKAAASSAKDEPFLAAAEARIAGYRDAKEVEQTNDRARVARNVDELANIAAHYDGEAQRAAEQRDTDLGAVESGLVAQRAVYAERAAAEAEAVKTAVGTSTAAAVLTVAEERLRGLRGILARGEANLGALAVRLEQADAAVLAAQVAGNRLADAVGRLATVETELLSWSLLAKACDRDGLPKLEIDTAGPTVSDICNDLLSVGYGTRFTVNVVTQIATADGKSLKEKFDVLVFDNEYGGEPRSISDLSGGERVVVEEALRASLSLYVNSRNANPCRTAWRDETTGALDPENAVRYVAMLRKMHDLGGFAHTLFITHNADVAAMADVVIRVEQGQPTISHGAHSTW